MTVFKEITNEDIYTELVDLKKLAESTHAQACKTNGRVTVLERKSIGVWISLHPIKFATSCLISISFLISDIRHPLIDLLLKLFI